MDNPWSLKIILFIFLIFHLPYLFENDKYKNKTWKKSHDTHFPFAVMISRETLLEESNVCKLQF